MCENYLIGLKIDNIIIFIYNISTIFKGVIVMGLKEEITKRYDECDRDIEKLMSSREKAFTTWSEISKKVKDLKKDMGLFAERFDAYFKDTSSEKIIELPKDIIEDINKNFIEKILEMKKSFIYVFTEKEKLEDVKKRYKRSPYSLIIERFENFYEKLEYDFKKLKNVKSSRDLAKIFAKAEGDFSKSYIGYSTKYICRYCVVLNYVPDGLCIDINKKVLYFVKKVLSCAKKELTGKNWIIGTDEKYFYEYTDSPRLEYMHRIEKVIGCNWVFFEGQPSPDEVEQNKIGDCYLMAALIALAKTHPKAITDCFTQGLDRIEKEEDIDIRFFRRVKDGDVYKKIPVIITVNKNMVIDEKGIRGGVLWPKLIEKAFAIFRKKGFDYMLPEKKNLEGGCPATVMFAITGKEVDFKLVEREDKLSEREDRKKSKFNPENLINTIIRKLKKGMAISCGFRGDYHSSTYFMINDAENHEVIKMYCSHAYAVVGVNEEKKYIELINPVKLPGEGRSGTGGSIAMSFSDFEYRCESATYTKRKDSPLAST